ncbi:MAG: hypothetical protein KJ587_02150 [Alphaproteobacteria bacterium]|nr:hypothetical protein [Alphaproteobacteria bacterium]
MIQGFSPQIAILFAAGIILVAVIAVAAFKYKPPPQSYNWQLGLLMATGIALSIASGWTTWDGMKNFTREPVLALLITFGIQAVLLVVSFLIGESFANRPRVALDRRGTGETAEQGLLWSVISSIGLAAGFAVIFLLADGWFELRVVEGLTGYAPSTLLNASLGTLAVALTVALLLTSGGRLFHRAIGLIRVAAQNAMLWVMLFACMAASVFFSFDSLFSTIFPQDERARASDIRTRGQIAELVNDVGAAAQNRRSEKLNEFSAGAKWGNYVKHLDGLSAQSARIPEALESRAGDRLRQAQSDIGALKVDVASEEARLQSATLRGEGLRREAERTRTAFEKLAASRREIGEKLASLDQQIAAKKIEAEQELQGLGVSARAGEGPIYRGLVREFEKLEFERVLAGQRLTQLKQQTGERQSRLDQAEAEVTEGVEQIARQTVKVETARKMLERASKQPDALDGSAAAKLVAEQLRQLEKARGEVSQAPSPEALDKVETACMVLAKKLDSVFPVGTRQWEKACRTDDLRAAAIELSQLSMGLAAFEANCSSRGSLPEEARTQELVTFTRRCIQLSGLPGRDIASFNERVGAIELNRDDMAHRFVVTISAFGDGNRLAFLALAIALAIDGLVFASGVFYAQAARSPLSDIPGTDGRPQRELQNIIDSALQPNKPESAASALEVMRPLALTSADAVEQGFTHEIDMTELPPAARATVAKLLGAAAAIGAVSRPTDDKDRYFVRGEVVTYISRHARLSKGGPAQFEGEAALTQLMNSVLADDVRAGATAVLKYFEPTQRSEHFATRVALSEVTDKRDAALVRRVLNAAAVLGYVRFADEQSGRRNYLLHRDVFVVLVGLAAGRSISPAAERPKGPEPVATPEVAVSDTMPADRSSGETEAITEVEPEKAAAEEATRVEVAAASTPAQPKSLLDAMEHVTPFVALKAPQPAAVKPVGSTTEKPIESNLKVGSSSVIEPGEVSEQAASPTVEDAQSTTSETVAGCAGSTALDIGIDFSDPAFPVGFFESLEERPAPSENKRKEAAKSVMERRSPVGSD